MLTELKQWVCVNDLKHPISPETKQNINALDPKNWMSYRKAKRKSELIAFVLTENDDYVCLDIDHCLTPGGWSTLATELCEKLPGALVEVSKSGKGLHIWCKGELPDLRMKKNTKLGIELYDKDRYIIYTGDHNGGDADVDHSKALAGIVDEYFASVSNASAVEWKDEPAGAIPDDDALIEKMLNSTGSAAGLFQGKPTIKELWEATDDAIQYYNGDLSSIDQALMNHLAFWTNKNPVRMVRLFESSSLVRDKWNNRKDYRKWTVENAIGITNDTYKGSVDLKKSDDLRQGYQFLSVDQLKDYFKGCTYISSSHSVLTPTGDILAPDRFKAKYGGYVFSLDSMGKKDTTNAFTAFTESQAFFFPKADTAAFRPERTPLELFDDGGGRIMVNSYVPVNIITGEGSPDRFVNHVEKLLPSGRDADIIFNYLAASVQCIGVKFQWAPLIQGVEGNGKTMFFRIMSHVLGRRYVALPNPMQLAERFNGWVENRLFAFIDEIKVPMHRSEILEALKPLVTNETIPIERKGRDQYEGDNRANLMLATNYRDAIPVTADSRRYAIFFSAQQTKTDIQAAGWNEQYFQDLYSWFRDGGYEAVAKFLTTRSLPCDNTNPALLGAAPRTSSTDNAIAYTRGTVEQEILEAVEQGRYGFLGGWISSYHLEELLREKKVEKFAPRNKRREILSRLGYEYHPSLKDGRANRNIAIDGSIKSRLFCNTNSDSWGIMNYDKAIENYENSQNKGVRSLKLIG